MMKTNLGICYLVATPIGNFRDITLRAIDILSSADIVVCEEYRRGTTLLKKIGVVAKEIIELNEHNEHENANVIVTRILKNQNVAVISDHGTPGFEDPGHYLIELCVEMGIRLVPIPGPSSLMAALSISNQKMDRFVYGGFLSRDKSQRKNQLLRLKASNLPIILLDTPYRLYDTLDLVGETFGHRHNVTLACNLTQPGEGIYHGELDTVRRELSQKKAEFVLIIY
jgi:16S rRNA (cytidine1402-2'-O)-methyltransferase